MAKYKILVIAHCLKNNVVAKCGDVVEESQKVLSEIKSQEAKTNSSIQN